MKKLTFSPIIALVVLATAIFPTYAVELIKAEAIDKSSLVVEAKHSIDLQFQQTEVKVVTYESNLQTKAALYVAAEKNKLDVQKSTRFTLAD